MGDLGSFLGALDGASARVAGWLEATVTALKGQGVATIADLEGAAFEDFSFADKELDAAQKRLVRAGIAAARTPAPVAGGSAATAPPAPSAAENAAALLAALKTGTSEAQAISTRSRARVAPRGASDMLDALNAEVLKRQKKESSEEARVFLYSDIRKWVPEWARSGPRDFEEEAGGSSGASKDIRDLAKEVAAAKKGPEKKAYLTFCQWQLAWNRCMVALVATGQLTWAEVQAHRDNCLKVAVQAAASKRRVHLGIVCDEEARKARPCVRACAAPCVCAGAWQLWAEQLRSGDPDFKLGKTILRVDPRALQLARDACDKEDGATHATAPAARAPEKARGAGGASQPWRAAQSWSSGSWGSDWPKGQKRERSWGSDWKKKDTRQDPHSHAGTCRVRCCRGGRFAFRAALRVPGLAAASLGGACGGPQFRSDWSRRCSDSAWRDICVAAGGCSGGDAEKLTFLARALDGDPALWGKWRPAAASALPPTAAEAVRWAAQTAPADVVAFREGELAALRERDRALRASGAVEEWFRGVDPAMRRVAQRVNGPLCAEIAERIAFCDPGCVEFFRTGAPLVGELPRSGHGSPEVFPPRLGIAELLGNAESTNRDISCGLRDGAHGDAILRKTRDEAELGRISCPVPLRDVCLDGAVIAPRFAVEQLREDGSSKLRLVDDMTKARINEATRPQERLHHDAVDALFEAARIFQRRRDNQIQGLELLSIALGMCTFAGIAFACDCPRRRAGCDLHIYSDNTGAESCLRKGAAKSFDHSCIVHSMWRRAVELDVDLAVFRVPTAENLADLPSRRARARRAVLRAGRGTAVAWAADFLAENGFVRACELASADAADLEGWPVTAQAPVPSVLDQLGAPVALPMTRGPRAALAEAAARLRSPADAARWREEERVRAMLQPCARSLPSVRSGLKCWEAYCIRMLKYPCMQLPPACADLVAWSALFRCGETYANYCSYVKIGCLLTGVCVAVFDRPEVRRARAAVRARADWTPRPRLFIRKSAVAALVELGARRPEWLRASMLFLFAYTFLLRVPSEALPAVRVADAGDAPPFQAALVLGKSELTLLLRRRKNRPQGSRLSRKCWCSSCRATCPVHTLGPWVARCGLGRGLFGGISAAAALRTLREMLAALGVQGDVLSPVPKGFGRSGSFRDSMCAAPLPEDVLSPVPKGFGRSGSFRDPMCAAPLPEDVLSPVPKGFGRSGSFRDPMSMCAAPLPEGEMSVQPVDFQPTETLESDRSGTISVCGQRTPSKGRFGPLDSVFSSSSSQTRKCGPTPSGVSASEENLPTPEGMPTGLLKVPGRRHSRGSQMSLSPRGSVKSATDSVRRTSPPILKKSASMIQ
ncbi:unnamed protein product, partial [Prorocentrum cordatum]